MSKLERVTYICLIVISILAAYTILRGQFGPSGVHSVAATDPLVGKKLVLSGISWPSSRASVVLAVNSRCRFCRESLPFYRVLEATAHETGGSVIVISSEPEAVISEFVSSGQFTPDRLVNVRLTELGIPRTPTLLIVGSTGRARYVFHGELPKESRNGVLRLIRGRAQ
jgi:hypothetical protein